MVTLHDSSWGRHSDILVYICVNIGFQNTTKTSSNFLQENTAKQGFGCISHQIWPPKLVKFKKKKKPFFSRIMRSTATTKRPLLTLFCSHTCIPIYLSATPSPPPPVPLSNLVFSLLKITPFSSLSEWLEALQRFDKVWWYQTNVIAYKLIYFHFLFPFIFAGIFGFSVLTVLLVPFYFIPAGAFTPVELPDYPLEDAIDAFWQLYDNKLIIVATLGESCQ